ncbi:hypothetical protein P3342_006613 [Pyrenophora teres f. teres]|uniref:Rhodopsin domain-containing protein n=1 Tax=Pyrenophora teres f. teres TaxID=97479 RepID=A0A6S6VZX5_9PLEO|nr:hypothetical protein HRS9139_05182 [Pyrenophora teres f. teres]KAE8840869.1 hypothetical protein PTNB85_04268 [Pyrenophora teres f. teres]KAE8864365.1 hypothetical protein PTNB29_04329 [Pyrenophora teres f. teres]KAE8867155.1 hypothetical protein PTNB73_05249 [Pyrenophora teres f. teres]KAK1910337.1 hypothetical protein P3342_006613 [Pyrenophora teres f. teres]
MVHGAMNWTEPAILIVSLSVTLLVYVARMWARYGIAKNAGLDDVLMSVAMLPLIGLSLSTILGIGVYGYQMDQDDLTPHIISKLIKIKFAIVISYTAASTMIKLSILCFYQRFTGPLTYMWAYCIWGNIAFCIATSLSSVLGTIFICSPVSAYFQGWSESIKAPVPVVCGDQGALFIVFSVISCIQDFVICTLPVFLVRHLQMPQRQKIAICGILGLGILSSVCGIIRAYHASRTYHYPTKVSHCSYWGYFWTTIEVQLAVICASAPAMKNFFNHYFETYTPRIGSSEIFQRVKVRFLALTQPRSSVQQTEEIAARYLHEDIPLGSIRVSHKLDVSNMPRTSNSPIIFAGTSSLAALPVIYASPLPLPLRKARRENWKDMGQWMKS